MQDERIPASRREDEVLALTDEEIVARVWTVLRGADLDDHEPLDELFYLLTEFFERHAPEAEWAERVAYHEHHTPEAKQRGLELLDVREAMRRREGARMIRRVLADE
jgi:hypothetical protein